MPGDNIPGVREVRLLRNFRVLRLFGRLKSLRRIIAAVGASLIPVFNALVVVFVISSVRTTTPALHTKAPLHSNATSKYDVAGVCYSWSQDPQAQQSGQLRDFLFRKRYLSSSPIDFEAKDLEFQTLEPMT